MNPSVVLVLVCVTPSCFQTRVIAFAFAPHLFVTTSKLLLDFHGNYHLFLSKAISKPIYSSLRLVSVLPCSLCNILDTAINGLLVSSFANQPFHCFSLVSNNALESLEQRLLLRNFGLLNAQDY